MNKILPITLSDQSNYEFIEDCLYAQMSVAYLDNHPLNERSSKRQRRYYYMLFDYECYVPICVTSSRRNRRLFDNIYDKGYVEKANLQFEESCNEMRLTWKSFIPSMTFIVESLKSLFKKDFWKNIYTNNDFRKGLKDWFVEMIQDYAVFPIAIVGIIYLYTLI